MWCLHRFTAGLHCGSDNPNSSMCMAQLHQSFAIRRLATGSQAAQHSWVIKDGHQRGMQAESAAPPAHPWTVSAESAPGAAFGRIRQSSALLPLAEASPCRKSNRAVREFENYFTL